MFAYGHPGKLRGGAAQQQKIPETHQARTREDRTVPLLQVGVEPVRGRRKARKGKVRIGYINIQAGLKDKVNQLSKTTKELDLDVMLLTETKLQEGEAVQILGRKVEGKERENTMNRSGGVGIRCST